MTFEQLKNEFPEATLETWHVHSNGGGWVQNTATVAKSAYVGLNARVYGDAPVFENARVSGDARVFGDDSVRGYDCIVK